MKDSKESHMAAVGRQRAVALEQTGWLLEKHPNSAGGGSHGGGPGRGESGSDPGMPKSLSGFWWRMGHSRRGRKRGGEDII